MHFQARIEGTAKERRVCFHKDKRFCSALANFCPRLSTELFEGSGKVVSLVSDDDAPAYIETIDLNNLFKRCVLPYADMLCKLRMPYARCYYTVQRKTDRDTYIVCTDTTHPAFRLAETHSGHESSHARTVCARCHRSISHADARAIEADTSRYNCHTRGWARIYGGGR